MSLEANSMMGEGWTPVEKRKKRRGLWMKEMVLSCIGILANYLAIGALLSKHSHSIITKLVHTLQYDTVSGDYFRRNFLSLGWTWLFACQENLRNSDRFLAILYQEQWPSSPCRHGSLLPSLIQKMTIYLLFVHM